MQQLDLLKEMMIPIVQKCLDKHEGGESYFDELDGMIKDNPGLMVSYLLYIVNQESVNNIITSGSIGLKLLHLSNQEKIPKSIKIMVVNGGLRKGIKINGNLMIPETLKGQDVIFFDDSYYSGKTANAVDAFVRSLEGRIVRTYVCYDGSPMKNDNLVSLFRYYR